MKPLESSLLRTVERRLNALARSDPTLSWRKRHGSPMAITGDPDIYGCWHSIHFEIELKRPGKHPTPLQSVRLSQWQNAGAHTFVVHTIAELQTALDTLREVVASKNAPAQ